MGMAQRVRHGRGGLRFISGLGAVLAAWAVGTFAADASACSGTSAGDDFHVAAEVPQNGQLRGTYSCQSGFTCSFPQTLEVLDSSGQPVAGELTVSEHSSRTSALYTFRPTQPWTLGETYSVTDLATAPLAQPASTFTVVAAVTLDAGRISADLELGEARATLDEVCCDTRYAIDSCGAPNCVVLEQQIEIGLIMHVALPTEHLGQWLSRLHAVDIGSESTRSAVTEAISPWGYPSLGIIERRYMYCVQVELLNLVDGTTVLREPQCVEHGTLADLGRETTDPLTVAQGISLCETPPPGFEGPWCEGMAERCESDRPDDACVRQGEHCGEASDEADASADDAVVDGPACSLAPGAQSSHTVQWGLVSLAGMLLARGWRRTGRAAQQRRRE